MGEREDRRCGTCAFASPWTDHRERLNIDCLWVLPDDVQLPAGVMDRKNDVEIICRIMSPDDGTRCPCWKPAAKDTADAR